MQKSILNMSPTEANMKVGQKYGSKVITNFRVKDRYWIAEFSDNTCLRLPKEQNETRS